ncbi:2-dehydropantoate 2-reductase, partial [Rhizobium leguminosarum]
MSIKSICIYGAGELGGAIAAKLESQAGNNTIISVV